LAAAQLLYAGPWVAERAAAAEPLLRANPAAIDPVVRAILQAGLLTTGVETFRGQYALKHYERAAEALWERVDVLLLPTTPTVYRIAEVLREPVALNSNMGLYTNFVNLLDMSAIAVPAGFRDNGTGFGVTFMGPAFADLRLQALAARFEAVSAWAPPPLDLKDRRPDAIRLAVVGAHLSGMPLNWQLQTRQARLIGRTHTAAAYRLYAIPGSQPAKPALVHVGPGGAAIEVEVYEAPALLFGGFVAEVAAPLAIGSVILADGSQVKGFVAEPRATDGAEDITHWGGWRAYIEAGLARSG
jgi:allophanate hydrolase